MLILERLLRAKDGIDHVTAIPGPMADIANPSLCSSLMIADLALRVFLHRGFPGSHLRSELTCETTHSPF